MASKKVLLAFLCFLVGALSESQENETTTEEDRIVRDPTTEQPSEEDTSTEEPTTGKTVDDENTEETTEADRDVKETTTASVDDADTEETTTEKAEEDTDTDETTTGKDTTAEEPTTRPTRRPTPSPTTPSPSTRKPTTQRLTSSSTETKRPTTSPTSTQRPSTTEAFPFDSSIFAKCPRNSAPLMVSECSYRCNRTSNIQRIPDNGKCSQGKSCMSTKCLETAVVDRCQTAAKAEFEKNQTCTSKCTISQVRRTPPVNIQNQNGARCVVVINTRFFKRTRNGTCRNGRCMT